MIGRDASPDIRGSGFSRSLPLIRRIFAGASIFAIAIYLSRHWPEVVAIFRNVDKVALVPVILAMALVHLLVATGFHVAQASLGVERKLIAALSSYLWRLPARYLPGGIWHTVARFHDIHAQVDVPKSLFARLFVLEVVLVGVSGLATAGISLLLSGARGNVLVWGAIALVAAAVLISVSEAARRWFRVKVERRGVVTATAIFALHWVVVGGAFAAYVLALREGETASCGYGMLMASYEFAASVGYVALFAPQGWGVAEIAFGSANGCGVSMLTAVALVTGFRLVGLLSDLLAFSIWIVCSMVNSVLGRHAA